MMNYCKCIWRNNQTRANADAQTMLGIIYEEGQGVSQDYTTALTWYRKAAALGHEEARSKVKELEGK